MKKISRKGFLKLAAAAAMGGVTAGALSACESASSTAASASSAAAQNGYTAGTYTATAAGINGDVSVTMTFDAEKITEVVIDASGETESIGGVAAEELANTILEAQTSEVDAISGATITSNAIKEAAAKCIAEAKGVDPESLNVQTETISWRTAPEAIPAPTGSASPVRIVGLMSHFANADVPGDPATAQQSALWRDRSPSPR